MSPREQRGPLPFSHSCESFETRLDAWFDLDEEQRALLRRAAGRCANCRSALAAQESLHELVDEASLELSHAGGPNAYGVEELREAPAAGAAGSASKQRSGGLLYLAAIALGVMMLALLWRGLSDREAFPESHAEARSVEDVTPRPTAPRKVLRPLAVAPLAREASRSVSRAPSSGPRGGADAAPAPSLQARMQLPSPTAASALLRSVERPRTRAVRPTSSAGAFSFRVPNAPSRSTTATGR